MTGNAHEADMTQDPDSFAPFDPATLSCPHAYWAALRARAPVKRITVPGNDRPVFLVSRRADVQAVAMDPATFSSMVPSDIWRWGNLGPELQPHLLSQGWGIVHTIASADPPMHTLYRKIVNGLFLNNKVKALVPAILSAIDGLMRDIPRDEPFDFMTKFAIPLPIAMISDMLGLPAADRPLVQRYTDTFVEMVDPSSSPEKARAAVSLFAEGQHYLKGFVDRLVASPDDGILSLVANARDDQGELLSIEERLSLCYLLMAAGNETTRNGLALCAYYLAARPDLWDTLKADREKVPAFVEEALRVGTPAVLNPRLVTRDTELAGVAIPRDAICFILWGSANRDEASFANADRIDLDRKAPRNHQAFGYGIHSCVGAPLARQELNLSVQAWLDQWESLSFAVPVSEISHSPLFGFRSFPELPMRVR